MLHKKNVTEQRENRARAVVILNTARTQRAELVRSIEEQFFTLPDSILALSGYSLKKTIAYL
ncbi:MAG: hypothetical protein HRT83_00630 [Hyphomicrobiaceae bacterium]|nr:hypothetical protein [Hyphomicrobiaceae bacterium]